MDDRTCNRCNRPLVGRQTKFCSHVCANRTHMQAKSQQARDAGHKQCDVDGCGKPARSLTAELCPMHYHRQYRYGTLERTSTLVARGERQTTRPPHNTPGERFGTLTLVRRSGSGWLCQCDCGQTRWTMVGCLNRTGDQSTCGIKANHLSNHVDYAGAHGRVRRTRGPASTHPCIDCGRAAAHWSYDHTDPNERTSQAEQTQGVAYSLDIEHYQARCVPCHKRYDMNRINSAKLRA